MMTLEELKREGLVVTVDGRYGPISFLRTDIYIAQSLGYYREFSEAEIALWRHFVGPGDVVVTAGANIGAHVLAFADMVGDEGMIFTAEPQPVLYSILCENIAQNDLAKRVVARNVALGNAEGVMSFPELDYRLPFNFGSLGGDTNALRTMRVPVTTIDNMIADTVTPAAFSVRLIHLDVEGGELRALDGASKTIRRDRPYLYIECDRQEKREALLLMLRALNYEFLVHHAPLFNPGNFAQEPRDVFSNTVSISVLCLPR